MKSKKSKVHAVFECLDCKKSWGWYLDAAQLARRHAEKYKHFVSGEIALAVEYDGKGVNEQLKTIKKGKK